MSDEFVIHGGGYELEVCRELGDPWEMDRREDMIGGGVGQVGEPESGGDGVNSKGLSSIVSCEYVV